MTIDKRISYDVQGGVKNYLGKQKEVTAPVKWKSSPDHPETELAYITKAEKDLLVKKDLHGSLKGGVNRGPSGIMSLNGFGSADPGQNVSGSQMSAAETGNFSGFSGTGGGGGPQLPPGVDRKPSKLAQDIRSSFIAAGGGQRVNPGFFDSRNTVSPAELARAKAFNPTAFRKTRGGGLGSFFTGGGFLGNIIRSLGQRFGLGKKYNQPTYDMSGINNTRVYENILGPSTNPNNLDIYNEFVDEEDNEEQETMTIPNVGSFGIMPQIKPSQQFIEELAPNLANPVEDQVGNIDDLMAKVVGPALTQMRSLEKAKALSDLGYGTFSEEDQQKLDQLQQMDADQNTTYSMTV
jgi:hypothetical protein